MIAVSLSMHENTAVVTIDSPPVNALSHVVRSGLLEAVQTISRDSRIMGAILTCAGRTFSAGADVKELGQPARPPAIYEIAEAFESLNIPVVAAIHGNALGGGLELALGCHYRLAQESAKLGFPEVTLGIIPGSGGIVRSVRLLDPETALSLITTGRVILASYNHVPPNRKQR